LFSRIRSALIGLLRSLQIYGANDFFHTRITTLSVLPRLKSAKWQAFDSKQTQAQQNKWAPLISTLNQERQDHQDYMYAASGERRSSLTIDVAHDRLILHVHSPGAYVSVQVLIEIGVKWIFFFSVLGKDSSGALIFLNSPPPFTGVADLQGRGPILGLNSENDIGTKDSSPPDEKVDLNSGTGNNSLDRDALPPYNQFLWAEVLYLHLASLWVSNTLINLHRGAPQSCLPSDT
jgi:hypothetical protein